MTMETTVYGHSFLNPRGRAIHEIARLEKLIISHGVEQGKLYLEREDFITKRETDLKILWEKRNSLNEREKKIQQESSYSKQEKSGLFKDCDIVRQKNDADMVPRIEHWDRQIALIDTRLSELQSELRRAQQQLEVQRLLLTIPVPEESARSKNIAAASAA